MMFFKKLYTCKMLRTVDQQADTHFLLRARSCT